MKVPLPPLLGIVLILLGMGAVLLGVSHYADGFSLILTGAGVALVTAGVRDLGDSPSPATLALINDPALRAVAAKALHEIADGLLAPPKGPP